MKAETQALRLFKIVQNHIPTTEYELALPLVTVQGSQLKGLCVNDVLLMDLKILEFVLIESENICANLVLKQIDERYILEITKVYEKPIIKSNSNKYETIKLSFGSTHIQKIEVGHHLDITQCYLEKITLMLDKKKLAKGSMVTIDHKLAIQINKVIE